MLELVCTCNDGYEESDDGSFCQDINECEAYSSEDEEDSGESSQYSFCSHTCANTIGLNLKDNQGIYITFE